MKPQHHLYTCILFVFLYIFLPHYANCQSGAVNKSGSNTLIIIGTVHTGNENLTPDILFKAIEKVRPDIILLEADSTNIKRCNLKQPFILKFLNGFLEGFAKFRNTALQIENVTAIKYKEKYPLVCLSSYDIYIPNRNEEMKQMSKKAIFFWNKSDSLFKSGAFSEIDSLNSLKCTALGSYISKKSSNGLYEMNSKSMSDSARKYIDLCNQHTNNIIVRYPELYDYADWQKWYFSNTIHFRNEEMCKRIKKVVNENKKKKILVLTGFYHKYFLADYFLNCKDIDVTVKEFYDF